MQCGILDCIVDEKRDISGTTSDIQIMSVIVNSHMSTLVPSL